MSVDSENITLTITQEGLKGEESIKQTIENWNHVLEGLKSVVE